MFKFAPFSLRTKRFCFCHTFALDCSIPWQRRGSITSSPSSASSSASWSRFSLSSRGGWSPGRSRVISTLPSRRRTSPSAPPSTSTLSSPWPRPTPPCSSSTATPASSPSSLASIIPSDGKTSHRSMLDSKFWMIGKIRVFRSHNRSIVLCGH